MTNKFRDFVKAKLDSKDISCRDIAELVYERACGTSEDIHSSIDYMIEDGEIDRDFYKANELDILSIIDSLMFSCSNCGWNYPISEVSYNQSTMADLVCEDCEKDD